MSTDVVWGIPRLRRKQIKENTERLSREARETQERVTQANRRVQSAASAVERASWQLVRDNERITRTFAQPDRG